MTEEDAREQNRSKKIRIHFGSSYKPNEAASPQLDFAIAMVKGKDSRASYARLSPYVKGVIFGMFLAGSTLWDIADTVVKSDGQHPCQQTVAATVARCRAEGGTKWDGQVKSTGRGPPRATTDALNRKVVKLVFKSRGRAKDTVDYLRKKSPQLRSLSRRTVARRLFDGSGLVASTTQVVGASRPEAGSNGFLPVGVVSHFDHSAALGLQ